MKKSYSVSIVIPNWNGVYLMRKHLPKVLHVLPSAEVIVADDHSDDGSVDWLRKDFPRVRVVAGSSRQGFAGNVNRGVAAAHGDIVVLLNTDVAPEKGFLTPLLTHFDDPAVFAVGCLEKSYEKKGITLRGRGEAKWEKGFFVHWRGETNKTDTAWVAGGSGAFRRSVWEELGGMDPLYSPFYWEDIDLSYHALKAGYKLVFEPKSVVSHYHEEGKIKQVFTSGDVKRIAYRNQYTFIWKNLSDPWMMVAHCFWTPIRLMQAVARGDYLMFAGYGAALLRLPKILRSRWIAKRQWRRSDREIFP